MVNCQTSQSTRCRRLSRGSQPNKNGAQRRLYVMLYGVGKQLLVQKRMSQSIDLSRLQWRQRPREVMPEVVLRKLGLTLGGEKRFEVYLDLPCSNCSKWPTKISVKLMFKRRAPKLDTKRSSVSRSKVRCSLLSSLHKFPRALPGT